MLNSAKVTLAARFTKEMTFINCLHVIIGSIFLALIAQIAFPLSFTPVPLTFQTLGVLLLAMALGKNKATLSVIAYLGQATAGLPVLAGGLANPAWMLAPRCGYLLGFVVAAYIVGWMLEKSTKKNWGWTLLSLASGELVILTMGVLFLSLFLGFENAFILGFVPFLFNAALKVAIAASLDKPVQILQKWMS